MLCVRGYHYLLWGTIYLDNLCKTGFHDRHTGDKGMRNVEERLTDWEKTAVEMPG
jgi:hypothetical protein